MRLARNIQDDFLIKNVSISGINSPDFTVEELGEFFAKHGYLIHDLFL